MNTALTAQGPSVKKLVFGVRLQAEQLLQGERKADSVCASILLAPSESAVRLLKGLTDPSAFGQNLVQSA